jgi:hypothetical protein
MGMDRPDDWTLDRRRRGPAIEARPPESVLMNGLCANDRRAIQTPLSGVGMWRAIGRRVHGRALERSRSRCGADAGTAPLPLSRLCRRRPRLATARINAATCADPGLVRVVFEIEDQ